MWNRSVGEPFYGAPFVAGEQVLIASSYGNLYSMKAGDGAQEWSSPVPNIDRVFASAGDYYFARTTVGQLTILTIASGQIVSTGGTVTIDHVITNSETDRIYLVSDGGTIQCLRPNASELPIFAQDALVPTKTETKETGKKPKVEESSNPFGAKEGAAAADPFGAGVDPFGGGDAAGDAPMEDPFGAAAPAEDAADPFGN